MSHLEPFNGRHAYLPVFAADHTPHPSWLQDDSVTNPKHPNLLSITEKLRKAKESMDSLELLVEYDSNLPESRERFENEVLNAAMLLLSCLRKE